jgi:hypothetical protein
MPDFTPQSPGAPFIRMDPLDSSTLSSLARNDKTQYPRVTKLTIKRYMEECLKSDGQFRRFFDKIATSTIGYHINEKLSEDLNERHLQIAAFYSDVAERPPQIFIQNDGYTYLPDSLGCLMAGWNMRTKDGHQCVVIMDVVNIPITLTCAALSEQEIEDLESFINAAFGQFQRFTVNYYLKPAVSNQGVDWEIKLPFRIENGTKTHSPLKGNLRQQIWQFTASMEVMFENKTYLQYLSQPEFIPKRGELTLDVPSSITVNQTIPVGIYNHTKPISIYTNDPRIAIVRRIGNHWVLKPRRIGTVKLLVTRTVSNGKDGPEILAEQDITIRAR